MARPQCSSMNTTPPLVTALAKNGVKPAAIARELGVDPKTLAKHFGEVIEVAAARPKMDEIMALAGAGGCRQRPGTVSCRSHHTLPCKYRVPPPASSKCSRSGAPPALGRPQSFGQDFAQWSGIDEGAAAGVQG